MSRPDGPLACRLKPGEMAGRRDELLPGLLDEAVAARPLPRGFRWRFDPGRTSAARIASVIDAERSCCGFLRFRLEVEPEGGPMVLEVTGPEGTPELLEGLAGGEEDGA